MTSQTSEERSDYITFTVSETKTIPEGGTVDVKITADIAGTDGNLPIGAIKTFPVTLSGLISVTNQTASDMLYIQGLKDCIKLLKLFRLL